MKNIKQKYFNACLRRKYVTLLSCSACGIITALITLCPVKTVIVTALCGTLCWWYQTEKLKDIEDIYHIR